VVAAFQLRTLSRRESYRNFSNIQNTKTTKCRRGVLLLSHRRARAWRTTAMSTTSPRAAMASSASCSATRHTSLFGRRAGASQRSGANVLGARRVGVVSLRTGRARPVHQPRVSVRTFALASADGTDCPLNAPRRLKIFSVNDGASPARRQTHERRRSI
jgi:hypothetical protein